MIEVKTAELDGSALDWAVAQVEGRATRIYLCPVMDEYKVAATVPGGDLQSAWMPSIDWAQGGPLIEKYRADLCFERDGLYHAELCDSEGMQLSPYTGVYGSTPLIAACRAIVAAKLGDLVSVPAELVP
jgi:hypothetical protein